MRLLRNDAPPPTGVTRRSVRIGLALLSPVLATGAFLVGTAAPVPAADPIQTRGELPVGVERSPAGAVAAADDYLVIEQATVERDPARFAALVAEDYAPSLRASAIAAAAADRREDPRGVRLWSSGGQSFTAIGAHRLDWYGDASAQVTSWAVQVFWGPAQTPCQMWAVARTTLLWRAGRWEVSSLRTLPTPAPSPAAVARTSSRGSSAAAFSRELDGFSPVSYGSPW